MQLKLITLFAIFASVFCLSSNAQNDKSKAAQKKVTILENGRYFDGKKFVPFKEIILTNGVITAISTHASSTKGERTDLSGKYVIPGLTDAHVHVGGSPAMPYVMAEPQDNANSALNCGVTTMIDLFYPEDKCKEIKELTAHSPELYATLIMSVPVLTAPGGHGTEYGLPTRTITSVDEARKITKDVIDKGADVIKLVYEYDTPQYIPSLSIDMVKSIVNVAHSMHKKVFAHIDRASQAVACAQAGVDVIAHMPADSLTDKQLNILKASGAVIIPTITVLQSAITGHSAAYISDTLLRKTANPAYLTNFSHDSLAPMMKNKAMISKYFGKVNFYANLRNCIGKGIPLLAGTDAGNYATFYGYSLHNELYEYVRAGMSNADALCTATQNLSKVLPAVKTGRIAVGYRADLVVLDADPLADISNTKKIDRVFHSGELAKMQSFEQAANPQADMPAAPYDSTVFILTPADVPPIWIFTFSDNSMGGNSEIKAALAREDAGAASLQLDGKIVKKGFMGFAGAGINLARTTDMTPVDISEYGAVEMEVKGDGNKYSMSLCSSKVKDYNYHSASFTTAGEWHTVRIPFKDFKQNAFYGKQIPLDLKTIASVSFVASGDDRPFGLKVKNIHFVK